MRETITVGTLAIFGLLNQVVAVGAGEKAVPLQKSAAVVSEQKGAWTTTFAVDEADLSPTGRNPYFILEPGHQLDLEGREDGEPVTLTITVLDQTKRVGNVTCRVVEERETKGGRVIEV